MPVATRPRLFRSRLSVLLVLVFAGLGSGCQSSRPGFSFQPARGRVQQVAVRPLAAEGAAPAPAAPATAPITMGTLPAARKQHRVLPQPPRQRATAKNIGPANILPARTTTAHQRGLLARPHATAEVGLGTTVLGVLGLVILPIALIGLAISGGGLVWAVVAGAAALAVLVAYLDPFGR